MHAAQFTPEQRAVYDTYKFVTYAQSIALTRTQLNQWRKKKVIEPLPVSREETLRVERVTRGQNKNELWYALRADRRTASRSSSGGIGLRAPALEFGNAQEDQVKTTNAELFSQLQQLAEKRFGCQVIDTVLNCGMFLSALGLHSASPDAYFAMADGSWLPVEIKCPFNYRDTTVNQMRLELGKANRKYRVKHTALLVNKTGTPEFEVVKTHDHYRQMQRQMYVMRGAPACFYVVRFKQNLVAVTVPRDNDFYRKEAAAESATFVAFALANTKREQFKRTDKRRASFFNTDHAYNATQVTALVVSGLYLTYGQLKCAFCDEFEMDSNATIDAVLTRPHERCNSVGLQINNFDNPTFMDFAKRHASLINAGYCDNARALATAGFYATVNGLQTFCCGVRGNFASQQHLPACSYYLCVISRINKK
jgi:hypothetical protein